MTTKDTLCANREESTLQKDIHDVSRTAQECSIFECDKCSIIYVPVSWYKWLEKHKKTRYEGLKHCFSEKSGRRREAKCKTEERFFGPKNGSQYDDEWQGAMTMCAAARKEVMPCGWKSQAILSRRKSHIVQVGETFSRTEESKQRRDGCGDPSVDYSRWARTLGVFDFGDRTARENVAFFYWMHSDCGGHAFSSSLGTRERAARGAANAVSQLPASWATDFARESGCAGSGPINEGPTRAKTYA
jgi:hypothetical protein